MPHEEVFFEQQTEDKRLKVVKSYDKVFAKDSFEQMQPRALDFLVHALGSVSDCDPADLPDPNDIHFADLLWEQVEEDAREDWKSFSYFIVTEETKGHVVPVFVSADWPTAEAFAKHELKASKTSL